MRDAASDDAERREDLAAWREAYAAGPGREPAECPSEERLAALVVGEVTGADRTGLADHVVSCPRCAEAYRTLGELHEAASAGAPAHGSRRARERTWRVAGAAAAALAAAVGLAVFVLSPPPAEDGMVRGIADRELLTEPPDGARLTAAPQRLSWSAEEEDGEEPGATRWIVLYDAEAVPLWRSAPIAARSVELPPSIREGLAPGTYYWRIRRERDVERSESPLLRFEIVR